LKPEQTGWLYEFGDVQHLAQLLQDLIDNRYQAKAMGENARTLVMDNYSINNSERQYEQLYTA
jgi:glycosyltransferase involved in cell wall biosynthesis